MYVCACVVCVVYLFIGALVGIWYGLIEKSVVNRKTPEADIRNMYLDPRLHYQEYLVRTI